MDSRRLPRTVIDPKVRQVGFFTSGDHPPVRSISVPPDIGELTIASASMPSSLILDQSTARSSLSPVMIPLSRHTSAEGLHSSNRASVSAPTIFPQGSLSPIRLDEILIPIANFNPSESIHGTQPMISPSSSGLDGAEFLNEAVTSSWNRRTESGMKADSFPGCIGETMTAMKIDGNTPSKGVLTNDLVVKTLPNVNEKDVSTSFENQKEGDQTLKTKQKTTKAERRAIQEVQRAAKIAAKDAVKGAKSTTASSGVLANTKKVKGVASISQKKDGTQDNALVSEKSGDCNFDKDGFQTSTQLDDKARAEKAKKSAVANQFKSRNRVELFKHLPQYEYGSQLSFIESKFFHLDHIHPSVYKVGLQYLTGSTYGSNARCKEMLLAFREAIMDYSTPLEKTLVRDLTSKISSYVSFLIECRQLSVSMGNAIRFLKNRIAKLPHNLSLTEAKSSLISDIDRFINEKIILADKVIVHHAVTKIRDGDVLLVYGHSTVVEMILLQAYEAGKQFRIIVVDSPPKLEGQTLLRKLSMKGLNCTYTHINAISYIMHEATRVFLGASSVLLNGTVYSRVGTACVAMVAHAFRVPVLICCEAYKFHERVLLDSICLNELGDPDEILKVHGKRSLNFFKKWSDHENLQLLNLVYDATPSDYVSMIVTEHGMIPPTSVPVIFREYGRDQLFF